MLQTNTNRPMLPDEMRAGRIFARVWLAGAGLVAVSVAVGAFFKGDATNPTTWAVTAAAMAVISSVVSAWTSRRAVELQEDAMEPRLVASVDLHSRYQMAQFRLTNTGGSSAHDLRLTWTTPLLTEEGKEVMLGHDGHLPVLVAGDVASVSLGLSHKLTQWTPGATAHGTIAFTTASGRKRCNAFTLSLAHELHHFCMTMRCRRRCTKYRRSPRLSMTSRENSNGCEGILNARPLLSRTPTPSTRAGRRGSSRRPVAYRCNWAGGMGLLRRPC